MTLTDLRYVQDQKDNWGLSKQELLVHENICVRDLRECAKKKEKKLTSVSFMYVCVAENVELLVFFLLFLHLPHRQFSFIDLCLSSKMY